MNNGIAIIDYGMGNLHSVKKKLDRLKKSSFITSDPDEIFNADELKDLLTKQIENRVRWRESVINMINKGVNEFIEIGPGKVLSGLVKRINSNVKLIQVNDFDDYALKAGAIMAELNCSSYKDAIQKVPNDQAIGFMPFDTNVGLTDIDRNEHYAYTLGLFKTSPIFETRKQESWEAFAGVKTDANKKWIHSFQSTLKNIPNVKS